MIHLVIGALAMAGFWFVIEYVRKQSLTLAWWQWALTVLGLIYAVLVLEVIVAFLAEGAGQGAFVMGAGMGIVAVVWGVLLGRFAFAKQAK